MKLINWIGPIAFLIGVLATLGHRFGLIHYRLSMMVFAFAVIVCVLVVVAGILIIGFSMYKKQQFQIEFVVLVLACSLVPIIALSSAGFSVTKPPMIHDITTDTHNPPVFKFIQSSIVYRVNSLIYAGEKVSAIQRRAYPDIKTFKTHSPPRLVYQKALFSGAVLGWEIVGNDLADLRFEAVTTTPLFGFVDDIVVRIMPLPDGGSAVDVRSMSRVGVTDLGANAKRIRHFLSRLEEELIMLQ
jgi:hypothetical protein